MRTIVIPAIICSLVAGCYSGAEYRWSAFIGCAFYGDTEACYLGDFPAASLADRAVEPADVTESSTTQLTVDALTRALHKQYIAYSAARTAALAAGRPEPSPAEFIRALDAGRPVSREEVRVFLEDALGPDWIHRIEPPARATATGIMEPI